MVLVLVASFFQGQCSPDDDGGSRSSKGASDKTLGDTDTSVSAMADAAQLDISDLDGLSVDKLQALYKQTVAQNNADDEELTLLNGLNTVLIQRKNKLQTDCVIASKVIPDGTEKLTKSSSQDQVSQEAIVRKVNVALTDSSGASPSGGYVLMVNDLYQSSPFQAGQKTTISKFSPIGGGNDPAPAWKMIYKLYLQPADPTKNLPPMDKLTLTIDIDGTVIASKPLLQSLDHSDAATGENKSYRVNLGEMMAMSLGDDCRVSDAQLNGIKDTTRQQIQDSLNQSKTLAYAQGKSSSEGGLPSSKKALIAAITNLRSKISDRMGALEPAREIQFRLTGELQASLATGCHANEPIRSLVIKVDGTEIASRLWKSKVYGQKQNTGACTSIQIRLGPDLAFTIDNDKTAIIGSSYTASSSDLAGNYKVGSIQYFSITKQGNCFDNQKSCKNILLAQDCSYDIYEKHSYSVSGVSLTVNGEQVYNLDGLSLIFDSVHAPWTDRGLWSNTNWIRYMQREDCNQTN